MLGNINIDRKYNLTEFLLHKPKTEGMKSMTRLVKPEKCQLLEKTPRQVCLAGSRFIKAVDKPKID